MLGLVKLRWSVPLLLACSTVGNPNAFILTTTLRTKNAGKLPMLAVIVVNWVKLSEFSSTHSHCYCKKKRQRCSAVKR